MKLTNEIIKSGLDKIAEEQFGEFGFSTLCEDDQPIVVKIWMNDVMTEFLSKMESEGHELPYEDLFDELYRPFY